MLPPPLFPSLPTLLLVILAAMPTGLSALQEDPVPDTTAVDRYSEVIPDSARSDEGLFLVHQVGSDYFFEIPLSLLGRDILLQTRITQAAPGAGHGGEQESTAVTRWELRNDRVLMRLVGFENFAADTLPVAEAVRSSNFFPILYSFRIEAYSPDSLAVVIDADALFGSDAQVVSISRARRDQYQVMGMNPELSFIESIRSYPENVEVRRVVTYSAGNSPALQVGGTISFELGHSLLLLPEEPMAMRRWDERVGFASVRRFNYGAAPDDPFEERFIRRWKLVPSDPEAYARGEIVEPVEPIVLYIDPATPERWRRWLRMGVEDWQEAFEEAGFRNAILAADPPSEEEDPDFDPADSRYSVIRYLASTTQNASGPYFFDPRSGEILGTHILWYHNFTELLQRWYLVQTAGANPMARTVDLPDEIMGELIRYVTAHEVGHALGLQHNLKAHTGVPVDLLRTRWVCDNGTSASVMDYSRFNYVAQPGDDTCFVPRIGPYDRWAIEWGYRAITGTAEDENRILDEWLRAGADDPLLRFGDGTTSDPGSALEALGDDPVRASEYGLANLRRVVENLREWSYAENEDYGVLRDHYLEVLNQWNRYTGHIIPLVGGVEWDRRVQGEAERPFEAVRAERQRAAMEYLEREVFRTPRWLLDPEILLRIEEGGTPARIATWQTGALEQLLESARMVRMIEQELLGASDGYPLREMLADLRVAIWRDISDVRETDALRRSLQRGYLERMEYLLSAGETRRSDIVPLVRGELEILSEEMAEEEEKTRDDVLLLHIRDIRARLEHLLDQSR